jgi:hypothetical protein
MYSNVDIKKFGDMQANNSAAHNLRQIPSENVDPKKSHLNKFYAGSANMNFNQVLADKLSNFKLRKNSCYQVNLVFSASPELFKDKEKAKLWELQTWEFIKKEFGEENLIYAVVHKDEKTPHFQVALIPVDPKGKVNASFFFDGRKKCNDFITRYNNAVKNLGLKRDKGKDKAKPQSTRDYYQKVKESEVFDQKVDQALSNAEKTLSSKATLGLIKPSTAMKVFKPFMDTLKRYKAQAIANRKLVAEAKKIKQENEDLKLKFENMGLSHKMKFSECSEVKNLIAESRSARAEKQAAASLHEKKEVLENSTLPQYQRKIKPH